MTGLAEIRLAVPEDAEAIKRMLASLAQEMGDGASFASTPDSILKFGFGPKALFTVLVATDAGLSLFFPHFSTTRGTPGVYVQDLWVDPRARQQNLGTRLLQATATHAKQVWGAQYIALTTHGHNEAARRFYHSLGFIPNADDVPMTLSGPGFDLLG